MQQKSDRDWTLLVVAGITFAIVSFMLFQHRWQSPVKTPFQVLSKEMPNFAKMRSVAKKKNAFFQYLRPFIHQENQKIRFDRAHLGAIQKELASGIEQHSSTLRKLKKLASRYDYEFTDINSTIEELHKRIDIIPESLVLAQAANESGWGTSRFARMANNLFGEWCYTSDCGIVPKERDEDRNHQIRKFDSVQHSIQSYINNLNTHYAYEGLRSLRAQLREQQRKISGVKLATELSVYSERREAYVNDIILMIEQNNLE